MNFPRENIEPFEVSSLINSSNHKVIKLGALTGVLDVGEKFFIWVGKLICSDSIISPNVVNFKVIL